MELVLKSYGVFNMPFKLCVAITIRCSLNYQNKKIFRNRKFHKQNLSKTKYFRNKLIPKIVIGENKNLQK